MLRISCFALGVLLLMTMPSFANDVHEYRLDNGMLVLLVENHNAPVINLNVVYRVGSKYEEPGITGISHLLEHMMFKTSDNMPLGTFDRRLKEVGADNNAYTWLDQTVYYETIAADKIDVALELEAERMRNLSILPEDHQFEMTVVRNELDQRDDEPFTLLYERLINQAFEVHPYRHPTIGWKEDVEGIKTEQIRAYYDKYYQPDNSFIVAVGDFDPDELYGKIADHFGALPASHLTKPELPVEPEQTEERRFEINRAGQLDYLLIGWHIPESEHPDSYALAVLGQLLGQGRTSRLYGALVDSGKCAMAQSWASNFSYADPFLFMAAAALNPGVDPAEVEPLVYQEIDKISAEGVTEQELARAKKQSRVSFVYEKDSIEAEARNIIYFELMSGYADIDKYLPGIDAVTNEDIKRVALTYLTPANRTVGIYRAQVDGGDAGAAGEPEAPQYHAANPTGTLGINDLLSSLPEAGGAGDADAEYASVTQLNNGLTVIIRENHNNPTVSINGLVRAGKIDDPAGLPGVGNFAVSMLSNGTDKHTKMELAQIMEDAGVELGFSPSREYFTYAGRALTEDFELLLDLLAEQLLEPSFPEDEIEKTRQQILAGLLDSENDTFDQAFYTGRDLLYSLDHPFAGRVEGRTGVVERIARDDLAAWFVENVIPDGAVLTIVGDVDAEDALAVVKRHFNRWQSRGDERAELLARGAEFDLTMAGQRQDLMLPDKSNVSLVWLGAGPDKLDRREWAERLMAVFILGGDMYSRLNERLRIKEGLTYGSFAWFSNGRAAGPFCVAVQVAPNNVEAAIAATNEELARYAGEGPSAEEMELARNYLTGNFPVKLANNAAVAGALTDAVYLGKDISYIQDYTALIKGIDLASVAAAAGEYMDPAELILLAAGTIPPVEE
ncbi:insulinase family protein [bacterium]|nr:insulinase family protein [bacterium]